MQFPFIKLTSKNETKVIPIIVGSINNKNIIDYVNVLKPLFENPNTIFVISSDFCHWGSRFNYTPFNPKGDELYKQIKQLDSLAIEHITN